MKSLFVVRIGRLHREDEALIGFYIRSSIDVNEEEK